MKTWIYRTPVQDIPDEEIHMVERHPEIEYDYTKLYILYDDPGAKPWSNINSCRKAEIPNYWYPEVKPGETVEMHQKEDISASILSLMEKDEDYAKIIVETVGNYLLKKIKEKKTNKLPASHA